MHHQGLGRRTALRFAGVAALGVAWLCAGGEDALAEISLPAVTVGAGLQTNFYACNTGCVYSPGTIPSGASSAMRVPLPAPIISSARAIVSVRASSCR